MATRLAKVQVLQRGEFIPSGENDHVDKKMLKDPKE